MTTVRTLATERVCLRIVVYFVPLRATPDDVV
jgi:hypothetical protein